MRQEKSKGKRGTTEFKFKKSFKVSCVNVSVETMMNGKKIFQGNI